MDRAIRVLIDTNIFISYFLPSPRGPGPIARFIEGALREAFVLLLPEELEREFFEKITTKPYLASRIDPREARDLIATLRVVAELVPIVEQVPTVVRDPDDAYLLAAARAGSADYLVTGDTGLLVLADTVAPLRIVTPTDFAALLAFGENDDPDLHPA